MNRKNQFLIVASSIKGKAPLMIAITSIADTAYITIKGAIYEWAKASSVNVDSVLKDLNKNITKAKVYLSTPGGDVFEMEEIINTIDNRFKPENVTLSLGAICASAGTNMVTRYTTTAKRNTQLMIHKPMGNPRGNEDQIASGLKVIKDITEQYRAAYAKKMGITKKEVEKLWAKGDYWLTAKEALKAGLIDAIEDEDENIDAETRLQLVACGAPNIPEKKQNPKDNNIMEKARLIAMLGLDPDATDAQIEAKIKANKQAAEKTANLEAQAKANLENAQTAKIKALLDDAEKGKKINAAQRANYEILAKSDFDNTKSIIDAITPVTAISEQLENNGATASADQSKWTYEDYQKNEAMADFEKLPEDKQKTLINAFYKE